MRHPLPHFWFRYLTDEEINLSKDNIIIPEEWAFKDVNYFGIFIFPSDLECSECIALSLLEI